MLTAGVGWANGFKTSSTFHSTKLHERPGIQSQAAAAVVTMDTSLRDRLVRTLIPNNVERVRGGEERGPTASSSFNIRDNKRNVERLLKQS